MRAKLWIGAALAAAVAASALWFVRNDLLLPGQPPAPPAAGTGVTAAPAAAERPQPPARPADRPFAFQRLLIETNGDASDACFRFSQPLDPRAEAHYADYLRIEPGLAPAVRVADADLCLGGLAYGTDYRITLLKGLPSRAGAHTGKDEAIEVSLGDRPSLVAISGDGFILPRDTSNGLAIQTVNVERVKIRVLRMSDRLLPSRIGRRDAWSGLPALAGEQMSRYQIRSLLQDSATLVWSGGMAIEPDHNRTVQTAFPLSRIIKPGETGAYLVIAEKADRATPDSFFTHVAKDDRYDPSDELWSEVPAHWVIATDIALTTLRGEDGLHVFARSLASAQPLSGITLSLLATGQDRLGSATTDANGVAAFAPGLLRGSGASAAASVVAYDAKGDFTLLDLNRPAFDLSDRGVAGRPAPRPIEAFLYTDRGVYRPGQTVEAMALLRDRLGRSIDDMPVTLVLRRPDGVEARRFSLAAQNAGGFHQSVALSRTAAFGVWSLEALVDPAGSAVGRVQFDVQDFVPQQLKVTLKPTVAFLSPGQPISASLDGQFLYGAPAAGLKAEAQLRIVRDPAPVPGATGYSFGLVDEKVDAAVQTLEVPAADAAGQVRIAAALNAPKPVAAPLKGILTAGLFEPGGRIVEDQAELPIRMQPLLIGIKPRFPDGRVQEGAGASFEIRAFDAAGKPVDWPDLHWRLVREDRVYDWFETGRVWHWHYHVVDAALSSGTVDAVAARPAIVSQQVDWGYYRLIVEDAQTQAATSVRFSAGWMPASEAADTPDKVDVALDKSVAAPGDTVHVRIQGPFAGMGQVTLAGDRVFETRSLAVPKAGATFDVTASEAWGAGAYVLVSMYRPLSEGRARDPVRAIGVAWLGIDPAPRTLSVAIGAPNRVVPRQPVDVPITVKGAHGGATYVTLAAVDEGILQLTRFASPDPVGFFFGKRKLGVDIRDDYGKLLDGSADAGPIREGGDEGVGGQPLPVISTRTVALFSGPVPLDGNGAGHVRLEIPDFEGQLRLMAVAYNHDAVGEAEAKLIVRDPVIAEVALPRFLAPGDTARLAILIHDTDGAPGRYHLALSSSGAASLSADRPLDFTLAVGERKSDSVAIAGLDQGIATIRADLTGPGGYATHREWQLAVRAAHYAITLDETALQAPGEEFRVDPRLLAAFIPGSVTVSLGYSGFSGIDVPSLLQSLYRYPYGCTEQLASTAYPLLYFNDPSLLGQVPRDSGVKARVQQAVDTILDRQDAAGRFGLWRAGDGEASPWLDVYALDFLTHAKEAGFAVPDAAIERGYVWLQQEIRQIDQGSRGFYARGADATRAYAEYVLARSGRADIGELRRLHDTAKLASRVAVRWRAGGDETLAEPLSLGHLAGALSLMGDRARGHDAMAMAILALDTVHYPAWWLDFGYYSKARDLSGLIAVAAALGDDRTASLLADRLRALPLSAADLNTQDKAWLLAAAHALGQDSAGRALSVNGTALAPLKLPLALAPTPSEIGAGYVVRNQGSRDIWRTLIVHGSPKTAPSAVEAGYSLTKEYLTLDGKPLDPGHLRQNDRLIVSLRGRSDDGDAHRTVLVDLLPAGWEIEAPIVKDTDYAFLGPLSQLRIREARDDRFVAAFDLGEGLEDDGRWRFVQQNENEPHLASDEFHVAYIVRVVTPGTFELPEAEVEDMYRPGLMARTDAGRTVADPR